MKTFSFKIDPLTSEDYYEVYIRGRQLINDPLLSKLSGFTEQERIELGLEGMMRAQVSSFGAGSHCRVQGSARQRARTPG